MASVFPSDSEEAIPLAALGTEAQKALAPLAQEGGVIDKSELAKMATSYAKTKRAVGASIRFASLPPDVQAALAPFDTDGSGTINASELGAAARSHATLQKTNLELMRLVTKLSIGFVVVIAIAFGTVFAASLAVVNATATLQASTNALTSIVTGATLRTAGGASELVVKPVGQRRELAEHSRHLAAALDFVSASGDDLIHSRRPVRDDAASWDAHGRALQQNSRSPYDRQLYKTVGTTTSKSADDLCTMIKEGQTAITVSTNVNAAGQVSVTRSMYIASTSTVATYGCNGEGKDSYGFQSLSTQKFFDTGTSNTTMLIDCPVYTRGVVTSCSVSVPI